MYSCSKGDPAGRGDNKRRLHYLYSVHKNAVKRINIID
jgi:hypothetical protein